MKKVLVPGIPFVLLVFVFGCTSSLYGTLRSLGYYPVKSPSNSFPAGEIVMISNSDPFDGNTVCSKTEYLGDVSPRIAQGPDIDQVTLKKLSGVFDASRDLPKTESMKAQLSSVKSIELRLSNIRIEDFTDATVFSNLHQQVEGCTTAIKNHEKKRMVFIQKVLRADGCFVVHLINGASLSAKEKNLLKVELGGEWEKDSQTNIMGKDLVWGIRDSGDLVLSYQPVPFPKEKIGRVLATLPCDAGLTRYLVPSAPYDRTIVITPNRRATYPGEAQVVVILNGQRQESGWGSCSVPTPCNPEGGVQGGWKASFRVKAFSSVSVIVSCEDRNGAHCKPADSKNPGIVQEFPLEN